MASRIRKAVARALRPGTPAPTPVRATASGDEQAPTGYRWLSLGAERHLARPRTVNDWTKLVGENLALVTSAFSSAGVFQFLLDAAPGSRPVLVVRETDRDQAWAALVAAAGPATYVTVPDTRKRSSLIPLATHPASPSTSVWQVFELACTPGGDPFAGEDAACEVQVWSETTADSPPLGNHETFGPGALLAPVMTNRWTHVIPIGERRLATRAVHGVEVPALDLPLPDAFSTTTPIDLVYTWVDGDDPDWQRRRALALGDRVVHGTDLANNSGRFASHDELRYSVRSVELYAGWVRKIFVVTDAQVPAWLKVDHPRLQVVDHRDIFSDPSALPTFNSHAIESQLHHIEGLAEHFLYLNDDFFFTSPARPEQYFLANGMAVFYPSSLKIGLGPNVATDTPVVQAAKNNRELLERRSGVSITQRLKHVPYALRRSVLTELEQEFPAEFDRTAASRLRGGTDLSVASSLAAYYGFITGRAVPGTIRALYVDLADANAAERLARLRLNRDIPVLCLNETSSEGADPDARQRLVSEFLEAYFPAPSSFEVQS